MADTRGGRIVRHEGIVAAEMEKKSMELQKKKVSFGLILALLLLGSGCQHAAVEAGWKKLSAGKLDEAESVVDNGLRSRKTSSGLWDLKMRICLLKQTWSRCPAFYKNFVRYGGNHVRRWALGVMVQQSLWAGMKSGDLEVRRGSVKAARDLKMKGLDKVLIELLSDPDPVVQALSAGMLAFRNEQALSVFRKLLDHKDAAVRRELARSLAHKPMTGWAFDVLFGRLARDDDPEARVHALKALGRIKPKDGKRFPPVVKALIAALSDKDGWVRAEATDLLSRLKRADLWPSVQKGLADPYLGAKLASLRFLRPSPLRREVCRKLAREPDIMIALRAVSILVRRKDKGFVPSDLTLAREVLKRAGAHQRWDVRAAAQNAAASMTGFDGSRHVVFWGLSDPHPRVRLAAARTGITLRVARDRAIEELKKLYRSNADLSAHAAHILALRRIKGGVEALEKLARKGAEQQKMEAVIALHSLRKGFSAVLDAWGNGSWAVRLQANRALWRWWRRK